MSKKQSPVSDVLGYTAYDTSGELLTPTLIGYHILLQSEKAVRFFLQRRVRMINPCLEKGCDYSVNAVIKPMIGFHVLRRLDMSSFTQMENTERKQAAAKAASEPIPPEVESLFSFTEEEFQELAAYKGERCSPEETTRFKEYLRKSLNKEREGFFLMDDPTFQRFQQWLPLMTANMTVEYIPCVNRDKYHGLVEVSLASTSARDILNNLLLAIGFDDEPWFNL